LTAIPRLAQTARSFSETCMPIKPSRKLETFPNPEPGRDYLIRHECPEYSAICPVTGQPDFGTITVLYTPDRRCVELKSLKLYLWSFRDEGHYFEQVTNQILDDLVRAVRPRRMIVIGEFNVRGGISSRVVARHEGRRRARPRARAAPSARPPRSTK
jgi:7-cyano-7-deazaguanine reductase